MSHPPRSIHRVLQVHTRYRQEGGEDRVVEAERALLTDAGLSVAQVIFDNAELRESESIIGDLRLAASAIWSRAAKERVRRAIATHRPQVIHVHNTFPAASPSVYVAASDAAVPVVQTLHNYRFVCPVATLFRDGRVCTDCVGRPVPWPGVLHACIHGSVSQSAVAATTLAVHRALGTFRRSIGCYVALTRFQRQQMVAGGLPVDRVAVIPNFLEPDPGMATGPRDGILFVGRLSVEKGIDPLTAAARRAPGMMRIVGTGPLVSLVERAHAAGEATYLGPLPSASVAREIRAAIAMVLPSIWYEGFPLTILEAFSSGTPVIGSRIGSIPELVEDGRTGLLFRAGDAADLADKIRWATDHPDEMRAMGVAARSMYEQLYRGPAHLAALLEAYDGAVNSRRSVAPRPTSRLG